MNLSAVHPAAMRARERLKVALTRSPALYRLARRPYGLIRFFMRRSHDPDYAAFGHFPHRRGLFLDVGANAGMSAMSFRIFRRENPILSIEPNPFHEADLRFTGRVVRRFSHLMCAVGDQAGTLTLYVPVFRGVPLTTEASLVRSEVTGSPSLRARLGFRMDGPGFTIEEALVPVRPVDSLEVDPDFVKLDVQGYEHEALLGMRGTIERRPPVILVESPDARTRALLTDLGYETRSYSRREARLTEEVPGSTNVLFLPRGESVSERGRGRRFGPKPRTAG